MEPCSQDIVDDEIEGTSGTHTGDSRDVGGR
jgi:hypothetical protein